MLCNIAVDIGAYPPAGVKVSGGETQRSDNAISIDIARYCKSVLCCIANLYGIASYLIMSIGTEWHGMNSIWYGFALRCIDPDHVPPCLVSPCHVMSCLVMPCRASPHRAAPPRAASRRLVLPRAASRCLPALPRLGGLCSPVLLFSFYFFPVSSFSPFPYPSPLSRLAPLACRAPPKPFARIQPVGLLARE